MKYLLVIALLLSGCTTVPVTQKFPEAPSIIQQSCKPLEQVGNSATISEFAKVVVNNYTEYYQCSTLVDAWQEWYKNQKKIFEELK
jgi:hypothetical protein